MRYFSYNSGYTEPFSNVYTVNLSISFLSYKVSFKGSGKVVIDPIC